MLCNIQLSVSEAKPVLKVDEHYSPFRSIYRSILAFHAVWDTNLYFNFYIANYDLINDRFSSINWVHMLNVYDANMICSELTSIFKLHLKSKDVKCNIKFPIWFSSELIRCNKQKINLHKKWKVFNNIRDYIIYSKLISRVKMLLKTFYSDFKQIRKLSLLITLKPPHTNNKYRNIV